MTYNDHSSNRNRTTTCNQHFRRETFNRPRNYNMGKVIKPKHFYLSISAWAMVSQCEKIKKSTRLLRYSISESVARRRINHTLSAHLEKTYFLSPFISLRERSQGRYYTNNVEESLTTVLNAIIRKQYGHGMK